MVNGLLPPIGVHGGMPAAGSWQECGSSQPSGPLIGAGTKDAAGCWHAADNQIAMAEAGGFTCVCGAPTKLSWQASAACTSNSITASSPGICRIHNPSTGAFIMGWLAGDVCSVPGRGWGSGGADLVTVPGFGGDFNMQQLCYQHASGEWLIRFSVQGADRRPVGSIECNSASSAERALFCCIGADPPYVIKPCPVTAPTGTTCTPGTDSLSGRPAG